MKRVLFVMGTRPEVIKLAPVVLSLGQKTGVECVTCSTGQHRQLLDTALQDFSLRSDVDLNIMTHGQSLGAISARVFEALGDYISLNQFSWIVVQGDTTSAMIATLCGFYAGIRVAHVEAGLRTYDIHRPMPEELNRRIISLAADLHFAPTPLAARNLMSEGIDHARVSVTGNTVVDALLWTKNSIAKNPPALPPILREPLARYDRRILITAHRRESFGAPLAAVFSAIRTIAAERPNVLLIYPVHPNPKVRGPAQDMLGDIANVVLCEPLGYREFVRVMVESDIILTDSGGVQEEAPSLDKPVLVLREETERGEGVEAGVLQLVGTDPSRICNEVYRLLDNPGAYEAMSSKANPYGDGRASARIADVLARML